MKNQFRKQPSGVVINNNKSGLREARKYKKLSLEKEKRIKELEDRVTELEKYLPLLKGLTNGDT